MKGWTVEDRLDRVQAATLVVNGRYDEATDLCVAPYVEKIQGVQWVTFEESSHLPHVEEEERFLEVVGAFLAQCDQSSSGTPTTPEA
jgi:L-proline amide hydrolase